MSDIKLMKVPAVMTRVSPTKDGGFSLGFHTNEVTEESARANILSLYNQFGWIVFATQEVYEIPTTRPDRQAGAKTQSERIRSVLHVLWQEKYHDKETFDEFYNRMTEAYIDRIKEELEPR